MRKLTAEETAIIKRLLSLGGADGSLEAQLGVVDVEDMDDGGMGSIRFVHPSADSAFGKELVVATAADSDGVEISIALNLDKSGRLFELDIWKMDFSPIRVLPRADELTKAPPSPSP